MKILWVCNTVLPLIAEHFGGEISNKEGWLTGLCTELLRQEESAGTSGGVKALRLHLAVAFPWQGGTEIFGEKVTVEQGVLTAYGFPEDLRHAERSSPEQEKAQTAAFRRILEDFQPDVIHCFGTEFPHALTLAETADPERFLIGLQGICGEIAEAYMANLPEKVQKARSFRDILKRDSLLQQREKFRLRGEREKKLIAGARHIAGRTEFDRRYAEKINPTAKYYVLNETLRPCFYQGAWSREAAEPGSIFLSQGDYPLKGFHTAILAVSVLKKTYPDVRLKVAGNSLIDDRTLRDKVKISGYGRYLRELICENGLEENVEILGKLSASAMKQECLKASVFLCCSANENSPNSLGEAMLLGVPCVAADVGGIPSLFTPGQDGRGYEGWRSEKAGMPKEMERQANEIADAIRETWERPGETDEMCGNAVRRAASTYDGKRNLAALLEIYGEIAGAEMG